MTKKNSKNKKKFDLKNKRWMTFSGSDKCFTVKEFNKLVKKTTFLYPIPQEAIDNLNKVNPHLNIKTYYFPYDKNLYGNTKISKFFRCRDYNLIYIGNDSGRRAIMKKYFGDYAKWSGKVDIWGGGAREKLKTYDKRFLKQHPFINWHGQLSHDKVMKVYKKSMFTLSVPKPRFEKVGFQVGRWLESVFSGCLLFLPSELKFANEFVPPFFIVDSYDDLTEKIVELRKASDKTIINLNREQKQLFRKLFNIEKQASVLLEGINIKEKTIKRASKKKKTKISKELEQAFNILFKLAKKEGIDINNIG